MKLIDHRTRLSQNAEAFTRDLNSDRLIKTLWSHIRTNYPGLRLNDRRKIILRRIVEEIFETQNRKPMFFIEFDGLPLCWNKPGTWKQHDYIKYQWGHLKSRNQIESLTNSIENLGLYSARCNEHIQTSMNIEELQPYGGALWSRIATVLRRRQELFNSNEWKRLLEELGRA